MKKFLDIKTILKYNQRHFAINNKFIKPKNTQEYYNKFYENQHRERKKFREHVPKEPIFPTEPLNTDESISQDIFDDEHIAFSQIMTKQRKDGINRGFAHRDIALTKIKNNGENYKNLDLDTVTNSKVEEIVRLYNDEVELNDNKRVTLTNQLYELVNGLGYLDFREFIALNRYVLEAKTHSDIMSRAKAEFLSLAINILNDSKKRELKKTLRHLEDQYLNKSSDFKESLKIDYILDNVEGAKELFTKFYYNIKNTMKSEELKTLNEYEKYQQMMDYMSNNDKSLNYQDYTLPKMQQQVEYEDYMDLVIKAYREERTKTADKAAFELIKQLENISLDIYEVERDKVLENVRLMIKFYSLLKKYRKIYTPTNIETEKYINEYLRNKEVKKITFESVQQNDPYFSPLSDEESNTNSNKKEKKLPEHLQKTYNNIKLNYFNSKLNYEREQASKKVDKKLADELGFIMAEDIMAEKLKKPSFWDNFDMENFSAKQLKDLPGPDEKFSLIEKLIENHDKDEKLEFMYNHYDYFSDKYKLRKRIAEETSKRVSIKDINDQLNALVSEVKRNTPNLDPRADTLFLNKPSFINLSNKISEAYGTNVPAFTEILHNENIPVSTRKAIQRSMDEADENFKLDDYDRYEIELYKGIKNDPMYKHYLYTHVAFFSERITDEKSDFPFSTKGYKHTDYLKYERLIDLNRKKEKLNELILNNEDSLADSGSNITALSLEDIGRFSLTTNNNEPEVVLNSSFSGIGKRKRCKAYATIKPGSGKLTVNGKPSHNYFQSIVMRAKISIPLSLTNHTCDLDVDIKVFGGGVTGQTDAIIPAISKALVKMNSEHFDILNENNCLKHDPRNKERKKPGLQGARKGQVYRRR